MYQVINILDKYAILIDFGYSQGAKVGKKVRILVEGEEIIDNEGEFLGKLNLIKDELEITKVYKKFSLCQKISREKVQKTNDNPFALHSITDILAKQIAMSKKSPEFTEIVKTLPLNIDETQCSNIPYKTNAPIKKGDLVEVLTNY